MIAGKDLDRLIAQKVFGFTKDHEWSEEDPAEKEHVLRCCNNCEGIWDECCEEPPLGSCYLTPKPYSRDIHAAWEILEFLASRRPTSITMNINIKPDGSYLIYSFEQGEDSYGRWRDKGLGFTAAEKAPLGICLAALKAIGAASAT